MNKRTYIALAAIIILPSIVKLYWYVSLLAAAVLTAITTVMLLIMLLSEQ